MSTKEAEKIEKEELGAGRSRENIGIFKKDKEGDWILKRSLAFISQGGAEFGEWFYTARKIDETNIESWINEWEALAEKVNAQGEESCLKGHRISARESFLRACNYFRTAEYGATPTHPKFHDLWKKSVNCFVKACALFRPPIQTLKVSFEGNEFPAYFWRPDDTEKKRPTFFIIGGNDSSLEECVLWYGLAAMRRGYNMFTWEYPGHRGAVHLYHPKYVKRQDMEVPFKAAFDYLERLPGVDERIAILGYSWGGGVALRVAANEKRVKACIPDPGFYDKVRTGRQGMPNLINKAVTQLPDSVWNALAKKRFAKSPLEKVLWDYMLWSRGMEALSFKELMVNYEKLAANDTSELPKITCPVLSICGEDEGAAFKDQARDLIDQISSKVKKYYEFKKDRDNCMDHCQLDNLTRGHQVVFDWLDELFDHKDETAGPY